MRFLFCLFLTINAVVYFEETFDENWEERWIQSESKEKFGNWDFVEGLDDYGHSQMKGLKTADDMSFFAISSKFKQKCSLRGKKLVLQYSVKFDYEPDCGSAFMKVFPSDFTPKTLKGDSKGYILFGPDICGKVRILTVSFLKGDSMISCNVQYDNIPKDDLTHLYTLEIDQRSKSYQLFVDMVLVGKGSLIDDWKIHTPRKIPDASAKKPDDWVKVEYIADPDDIKPDDWEEEMIFEKMPDYWNTEVHGKFVPKKIKNPNFGQKWNARIIKNPDFKGDWTAPLIDNPDFVIDDNLLAFENMEFIAFPLWQVKSGTIIGNILITDDLDYANQVAEKNWKQFSAEEKEIRESKRKHSKTTKSTTKSTTGRKYLDAFLNDEDAPLEKDNLKLHEDL